MPNIIEILDSLDIKFKRFGHPAVFTVEQAQHHAAHMPSVGHTKNLFLKTEKSPTRYYLYTLPHHQRADLKSLAKSLDLSCRLTFASDSELKELLGLTPGSVSPLGLINDTSHRVQFLISSELLHNSHILMHPNDNTATIEISVPDFQKFLSHTGHTPRLVT